MSPISGVISFHVQKYENSLKLQNVEVNDFQ